MEDKIKYTFDDKDYLVMKKECSKSPNGFHKWVTDKTGFLYCFWCGELRK